MILPSVSLISSMYEISSANAMASNDSLVSPIIIFFGAC